MTILDQLAAHARERVERQQASVPLEMLKREALQLPKGNLLLRKH